MAANVQDILDEIESKKRNSIVEEAVVEPFAVEVVPVFEAETVEVIAHGRIKRLLYGFFPVKGDSVLEIIRKIIFIISLTVAIICFTLIFSSAWTGRAHTATYDELRSEMERSAVQFELSGQVSLPAQTVAEMIEKDIEALRAYAYELSEILELPAERILEIMIERPGILPQFITTYNRNDHLIGWLKIPGTRLDYPVLQNIEDNHFYLKHDIDRVYVWGGHGSVYADWRNVFAPDSRPDNTILYAHNMNDGSMFHPVVRYYSYYYAHPGHITHYLNHPIVEFSTLYEHNYYKVFAAIFVHTEEEKYDDVYDYFRKRTFPDRAEFYDFMQNVMDRSSFFTGVDIQYGDEILTLSTCHYPFGEHIDARVGVFARRLREGESPEDFDLSAAYVNLSPLYFSLYYSLRGGGWAGRDWDTSKVIGLDEFLLENPEADTRLHYLTTW
jgi:SrtB family sortase